MNDNTRRMMGIIGCIMILISFCEFIHTEEDWLKYLIYKRNAHIVAADIVDIISGKSYRDTSYYTKICYSAENETFYHVLLSDYRDFRKSKISVGILPTGEVVRTRIIIIPNMFLYVFLLSTLFLIGLLAIVKAIRGQSLLNRDIRERLNKEVISDIDLRTGWIIGVGFGVIIVIIGIVILVFLCK
ncbi:MAG: hypothetical protein E7294_13975 [Lachnospiraceae bacterium]|nr:hypothetical protein [Lachnospiraceae bacterium]